MEKKIGRKIRLFIVEDDPVQAQVLVDSIVSFDKDVKADQFISGEELLKFLDAYNKESKVHYLILDYFLQNEDNSEGINGLEVIKLLSEKYSYIKIILFSAYDADENLKFENLKKDYDNLIGVIKKSEFGYETIKNTVRYDFVKELFSVKNKRFVLARIIFFVLTVIAAIIYFLF